MIEQILVIKDSGVSLFSWQPGETEDYSQMISGFLTAINIFAQQQKGEQIKEITMDPTTFIFQRFDDNILVILTQDKKFETVIFKILEELKNRFIEKYGEYAREFKGDLSHFETFSEDIQEILQDFHYFEYYKAKQIFAQKESIISSVLIERNQGNIDYIISKEFLDRNSLGFHSSMLVKTGERLMGMLDSAPLRRIFLITELNRSIFIRESRLMILLQEISPFFDISPLRFEIKKSKLKKIYKKPGKLLFEFKTPFILSSQTENQNISNFIKDKKQISDILVDLNLMTKISSNISQEIYKDSLFMIGIIAVNKIFAIVPFSDNLLLISPEISQVDAFNKEIDQCLFDLEEQICHGDLVSQFIEEIARFLQNFT